MWTLETTRIYVQKINDATAQEIAALGPLGGGTIHQAFGWNDMITKVSAYVVGFTDKGAIEDMRKTGNTVTFSGTWGVMGEFYLKGCGMEYTNIICQTLRPDLPEGTPVFLADLELWKDEA